MNVYIWDSTWPVTDNWHADGGLLIVAESLEDARSAWKGDVEATKADPDRIIPTQPGVEPMVLVFPDAGCC